MGDDRIVYEMAGNTVTIWAVRHRKHIYPIAERRWLREG